MRPGSPDDPCVWVEKSGRMGGRLEFLDHENLARVLRMKALERHYFAVVRGAVSPACVTILVSS
jgi:predicted methyltransferase MtxX (methanogen marker protein 4)